MKSTVFASKAMTTPALEKKGIAGWRRNDAGGLEELIFCVSSSGTGEWVCVETYRTQKADERRKNREFYATRPHLLTEKVRQKKLSRGGLGAFFKERDCPWHAW